MASRKRSPTRANTAEVAGLRIIGGRFRRRKLCYSGDARTRPMKDRVREALFNLLGRAVEGKIAIDLFAGTGALALEALSRGALRAVAIEMHRPTARLIWQNAAELDIETSGEPRGERNASLNVVTGDAFIWAERMPNPGSEPWLVFCSPPYDFYAARRNEMLALLSRLIQAAPAASLFVVEADDRFRIQFVAQPAAMGSPPLPAGGRGDCRKANLAAGLAGSSHRHAPSGVANPHVSSAQELQSEGHPGGVSQRFAADYRRLGYVDSSGSDKLMEVCRREGGRPPPGHDAGPSQALHGAAITAVGGCRGPQVGAQLGRVCSTRVDDLNIAGLQQVQPLGPP